MTPNFETSFLENANPFQKTGVPFFKIGNAIFPYKTALPEPMLRQIVCGVQNGPITKNGVLQVTTLFFRNFPKPFQNLV